MIVREKNRVRVIIQKDKFNKTILSQSILAKEHPKIVSLRKKKQDLNHLKKIQCLLGVAAGRAEVVRRKTHKREIIKASKWIAVVVREAIGGLL